MGLGVGATTMVRNVTNLPGAVPSVRLTVAELDYAWFSARFESLFVRLEHMETTLNSLEQRVGDLEPDSAPASPRAYYSVAEFAAQVGRNEYTVREWCRLERIHAEKCETGRGDAKSWKIPAEELERYRDHGLLPLRYLR